MTDIEIRELATGHSRAAAAVAARALLDAPTTVAAYGDNPYDRLALPYGDFALLFTSLPAPQIGAFCGDCLIAVAAVTPPGGCIGSFFREAAPGVLARPTPGLGDPSRVHVFWAHWALQDPVEEHWHIGPVAVEPGFQGRGTGAALMSELCARLDEGSRVGWLETDKESNVRFYRALGFEIVEMITILGVPTWLMRRDPVRP